MANAMIARTIVTPQLATAASMLVRIAHPADQSLHRALAKAEPLLITQPWRVDEGVLRISSVSHPGDAHRTDGTYCECETRRGVCWHRASWMILSTLAAAGIHPVADLPLPAVLDEEELPASSFLDGDFSAFEDMSLLGAGYDDYGDVIVPALDTRVYFDEVVLSERVAPAPFRIQAARTFVPDAGSELARSQAACDELFAA